MLVLLAGDHRTARKAFRIPLLHFYLNPAGQTWMPRHPLSGSQPCNAPWEPNQMRATRGFQGSASLVHQSAGPSTGKTAFSWTVVDFIVPFWVLLKKTKLNALAAWSPSSVPTVPTIPRPQRRAPFLAPVKQRSPVQCRRDSSCSCCNSGANPQHSLVH